MIRSALAAAALVLAAASATAAPITYRTTATATGTLGGTPFTDALVTITGIGDTTSVTCVVDYCETGTLDAMVSVAGIGTADFTIDVRLFAAWGVDAVGFFDNAQFDILDTFNPALAGYDLQSPFGPVTGESAINSDDSYATTLGLLLLTSAGDSTFEAFSPVPEPATLGTLGFALASLAALRRRRARPV
jgi:hypothetical protein